jgi:hypothetical protein
MSWSSTHVLLTQNVSPALHTMMSDAGHADAQYVPSSLHTRFAHAFEPTGFFTQHTPPSQSAALSHERLLGSAPALFAVARQHARVGRAALCEPREAERLPAVGAALHAARIRHLDRRISRDARRLGLRFGFGRRIGRRLRVLSCVARADVVERRVVLRSVRARVVVHARITHARSEERERENRDRLHADEARSRASTPRWAFHRPGYAVIPDADELTLGTYKSGGSTMSSSGAAVTTTSACLGFMICTSVFGLPASAITMDPALSSNTGAMLAAMLAGAILRTLCDNVPPAHRAAANDPDCAVDARCA